MCINQDVVFSSAATVVAGIILPVFGLMQANVGS